VSISKSSTDRKGLFLLVGLVAGLALASIWPHEPLSASTSDRNEKFAMITTPVGLAAEGVFVLDFLTGRLSGAVLSRTRNSAAFTNYYFRNVADDFQVRGAEPNYTITGGVAEIPNAGAVQFGASAIYIAELNSGVVRAYGIPYRVSQVKMDPVPLLPGDSFSFREATVTQ
jgi:hypothetical protein